MSKTTIKPIAAVVGVAFVSSMVISSSALASDNPFEAADLENGYMLAGDKDKDKDKEGECGEGSCGEGSCGEEEEGSCGEGSCGEDGEEGKCGEGSCGEDDG